MAGLTQSEPAGVGETDQGDRGETVRRSAVFSGAVQIAGVVFTSVLTLFLVRALGRADYGRYSIALAVAAIVLLPSDLGISASASRSLAEAHGDPRQTRNILAVAIRLKVVLAVVAGGGVTLLAPAIAAAYGDPGLVTPLRLMGLSIAAHSLFAFFSAAFIALRQMGSVLRIVTVESVVETTAAIALVAGGAGVAGAVAGRAVGYGLGACAGLVALARRHGGVQRIARERFDRVLARRLALYASAVAVVDIIWAMLSQVDVLIIGIVLTPTAVASFQAPSRLLSLATYPGLALSYALGPRLARVGDRLDGIVETLATTARTLLLVQALAAAITVVFAPQIVAIALGGDYTGTSAETVLRCLAPYVALSGLAPLLSSAINYVGGARRRIWIAAATLVVNVALNLLLLPLIGPVGAAIALDVGYSLFAAGHVYLCTRLLDVELGSLVATATRTTIAAGAMIAASLLIGLLLSGPLGAAVSGVAGCAVFVAIVLTSSAERALIGELAHLVFGRPSQGNAAASR